MRYYSYSGPETQNNYVFMVHWGKIGHEPYSFEQLKNVLHISELFVFVQPQQGPFSLLLSLFPGRNHGHCLR